MQLNPNIITVDEKDNPIGEGEVLVVHRGTGIRHRAISAFLFNKKGELLIQQRSTKKIVGALQWANTCCGNVHVGESRLQCAYRRLKEELGIVGATIRPLYKFEYHVPCNDEFSEWEIDEVFVGKYDGDVSPNSDEVASYTWIDVDELVKDVEQNGKNYSPWLKIILKDARFINRKV